MVIKVQEGGKKYEYDWLDKAIRVTENGRQLAKFEYRNNGQLARAMRGNDIETFEWDGLALTERNGTKYINEPHAGGGNPILATTSVPNANSLTSPSQSQTIFTNMLGTSLGTVKNNAYSEIEKTAFGNLFSESAQLAKSLSSANTFFTGKPYVEDLGYIFLLRNYRADMGKWLSQDLIGYPDGWNNFTYCGNKIISYIDLLGCAEKYIKTRNLNTSVPVIKNYQHSWTEIRVTRDEYNNMSSDYKTGEFANKWVNYGSTDDYYSITLSAYKDPDTGKLVKATGDPRDSGAKNIYDYDHDFTLSEIERTLELHKKYNNSADYTDIPLGDEVNNCNSYTNTINGGDLPNGIIDSPGIDKKINNSYYE